MFDALRSSSSALLALMLLAPALANVQARTLESIPVRDLPGVTVEVIRSNKCSTDAYGGGRYCKLVLELFENGERRARVESWDIYPEVSGRRRNQTVSFGKSFAGPAWILGKAERVMIVGALPVELDAQTTGIALKMSAQGADYLHDRYEIWAVLRRPKLRLQRVYEGGATNGPFFTELRLFTARPELPFLVAS